MDDSQRTGYRGGVRFPAIPRALLVATVVATLLVGAGGYVLGQTMGDDGTPASAPVSAVRAGDQPDPIVIPEPLEVPGA